MRRYELEEPGRKVAARVCVVTHKPHVRRFLCEALEQLGLVACGRAEPDALGPSTEVEAPDLVIIGLSLDGPSPRLLLRRLSEERFKGKVLLIGQPGLAMLSAAQRSGAQMGLSMLPALCTPYRDDELRARVSLLISAKARRGRAVEPADAS